MRSSVRPPLTRLRRSTRLASARPSSRRLSPRQRAGAIALSVLAVCFIALDLGGGSLQSAHSGVRGALGALYRGTDSVLGPVRRFVQGLPHAGSQESRVHELQQQNAELRKRLADAATDRATRRRLRALQLGADDGGYRVLPARVVATDPAQGFDYTVTIDVGSTSGVRAGQTVTDGAALVGRVLHADDSTSVVLLGVDSDSGVGARDLRTGQLGVASGAGHDGYTFRPLDPHATLRVGDTLSTGPASASSFVAGLTVGTVRSVHTDPNGTDVARVDPAASPTALDLVGVILQSNRHGTSRAALTPSHPAGG